MKYDHRSVADRAMGKVRGWVKEARKTATQRQEVSLTAVAVIINEACVADYVGEAELSVVLWTAALPIFKDLKDHALWPDLVPLIAAVQKT